MSRLALVVEDDLSVGRALEWLLASMNISTTLVSSGVEAVARLNSTFYDIVLLDMTLDDMDGLDLLKAIPTTIDVPILVLSGDDSPQRKTAALTTGARDYVVKPFDHAELCARIKLLMRGKPIGTSLQVTGPIVVDAYNHTASVNGELLPLTQTELRILEILSENKGTVIPKNELLVRLYSAGSKALNVSMIGVYIYKIRRKIAVLGGPADGCIQSLKGRGYIFRDPLPLAANEQFGVEWTLRHARK